MTLDKEQTTFSGGSELPETFVYNFSAEQTDGHAGMRNILGGKGANLAEMTSLGIAVPPGFTISTEICGAFYRDGGVLSDTVRSAIKESLAKVEKIIGKTFGGTKNCLLVSVRSGARVSMPGMMDTILNLGLNDETVETLSVDSGNERFAWDSYRRFIQMYSNVVMGMNTSMLDVSLEDMKYEKGYKEDTELTVEDLKALVVKYKRQVLEATGKSFPLDPVEQLWGAISAVFKSWNVPRAITYRELNGIDGDWGTAVNIQSMVYGNMGETSATGVAFTRNPSTGENCFYGEYLLNAQGEDVVAGIRTPQAITKADSKGELSLEEAMPKAFSELVEIYKKLEAHYRDMQDIEFTIENGKLWMLQTRTGKRTAAAALKIAEDMIGEGLITEEEALLRIEPSSLDQLLHPRLDPSAERTLLSKGLPASPGGACGGIVFDSETSVSWNNLGKKSILVRIETSPEDIEGMISSVGILTSRGGMTSHAAVVARGMGKCCVAGCAEVEVNYTNKTMRVNGYVLKEGDIITLDGSTGEIFLGEVKTIDPELDETFENIMTLADKYRKLGVRTNADTPKDALIARRFGAEGIGLCRTEHMFFGADRIDHVRRMIMASSTEERKAALETLLPFQRQDFKGLFEAMDGFPVTIRLLDPPLHEFLPHGEKEISELAERLDIDKTALANKVRNLYEFNPMLGHRGCRLAITYPEVYQMQARAIGEATADLIEQGKKLVPEVMIPLVAAKAELSRLREVVEQEIESVQRERSVQFDYLVGTMIELPRAALTADKIAEDADFFSFGTNDLTQTCLGISRDDSGRFMGTYVSEGIFPADPFASIDVEGVGELVKTAVKLGRQTREGIKLGICGEHGGDPDSIQFFQEVGLDYISCSPFRVPIARLAAARAFIQQRKVEH